MKYVHEFSIWEKERSQKYRLYDNLEEKYYSQYWEYIEQRYIAKYERLYRVEFEWSSTGIWAIPYPGSISLAGYVEPADWGVPANIQRELQEWLNYMEDFGPLATEKADWDYFNRLGLAVAKDIVKFLPENCYLEYHALRQIVFNGIEGIELNYDEEIRKILRL